MDSTKWIDVMGSYSCVTCRFRGRGSESEEEAFGPYFGYCRRWPPQWNTGLSISRISPGHDHARRYNEHLSGYWPMVGFGEWCGEWQPKEEEKTGKSKCRTILTAGIDLGKHACHCVAMAWRADRDCNTVGNWYPPPKTDPPPAPPPPPPPPKQADGEWWVWGQYPAATTAGIVWDFQGIVSRRELAIAACRSEFYFIAPARLDYAWPDERCEWPGAFYPRQEASAE